MYECRKPVDCFDDWFGQLATIAKNKYGFNINERDKEDWREYYDDEFTPSDALYEDMLAGL